MRVLYGISNLIYFVVYKLLKYRVGITKDNLTQSFPTKSNEELLLIEKEFYKNLCDSVVETIKMITISKKEINKRVQGDWDKIAAYQKTGRVLQIQLAHQFNWEWAIMACSFNTPYIFTGLYNPISNKGFNKFMLYIRGRFGTELVNMNEMQQLMGAYQKKNTLWGFIADQNPSDPKRAAWVNFLGRETAFYKGGELVARRYNNIVLFGAFLKIKRGYYKFTVEEKYFEAKNTKDEEITQAYVSHLEAAIYKNPSNWVWSHRRWKHKRKLA